METGVVLPDHIIEEILLRLPVKHLLRWKCVSKHYYALIWNDDFVKKHYRFHYSMHLALHGDVPRLLKTHSETQFHLLLKQGDRHVVENITPDPELCNLNLYCRGLVNGIVALEWGRSGLALWNPATREIKYVPWLPLTLYRRDGKRTGGNIKGLGFDLQSNDFKILGGICTYSPTDESDDIYNFCLYSLKDNSWKMIKDTPRTCFELLYSFTDGYFNNGVYYWIASESSLDDHPSGIVSFNFSSEIFKEFELPIVEQTWFRSTLMIGKYKEGLALLLTRTSKSKETCVEIWAATEFRDDDYDEVSLSWQLVVKVPPISVFNNLWVGTIIDCVDLLFNIQSADPADPDYEERGGGDIYFAEAGAYVYHPSTHTFNYLGFDFLSCFRYVESLYPLSSKLNHIDITS